MNGKEPLSTMQIYHEICRACMRKEKNMKCLFKAKMHSLFVSEIFSMTTPVIVTPEDGLPANICTECLKNLTNFYKFQQMCVNSDIYMRNALKSHNTSGYAPENDDPLSTKQFVEKGDAGSNDIRPVLKFEYDDFKNEDFEDLNVSDEMNFNQENLQIMTIINSNGMDEKSMISDENLEDENYNDELSKESEDIFPKAASNALFEREKIKGTLEERSYKCKICLMEFSDSESFLEHREIHTNSEIGHESETELNDYEESNELENINTNIQIGHIKKEFYESEEEICYPSDLLEEVMLTSCPANCSCENCTNISENVFVHGDISLLQPKENARAEHTNSRVNCIYCGLSLSSFNVMRKHIKRKHKNKKIPSKRIVVRKAPMLTEYRTVSLYECNVCNKIFESQQILLAHKKQFHNEPRQGIPPTQMKNSAFTSKCPVCGKELNKKRYRVHLQQVHKKNPEDFLIPKEILHHPKYKPVQCRICFRKFSHNQYLQQHLIVHKKTDGSVDDQSLNQTTDTHSEQNCSTPISETISETKTQTNTSKKLLNRACNICGKSFSENRSLKRHILSHDKFKNKTILLKKTDSKCQVCHRELSSWYSLRRHIREVHAIQAEYDQSASSKQTNLYRCELCNKIFFKRESLMLHNRVHLKESKSNIKKILGSQDKKESDLSIKSEAVNTAQSKSKNLQKNIATRENRSKIIVRIRCLICKMHLCSKHSLLRHMRRRHKEFLVEQNAEMFPFQCGACTKIFQKQTELIAHMKAHRVEMDEKEFRSGTENLSYRCSLCTKTFKRPIDLAIHTKRVHVRYVMKKNPKASQAQNVLKNAVNKNLQLEEVEIEETNTSLTIETTEASQSCAKAVSGVVRYECHFCQTALRHFPSLLRHLRERHGYDKTKELVYKYFCNECNLFLESQEQLNKHNQQTHTSNEDPLAISAEENPEEENYMENK